MMKIRWPLLLALALLVLNDLPACADLLLKNGRTRRGEVTKIDNREVEITRWVGSGKMVATYPRERIDKIEGLTYDDFKRAYDRKYAFINDETKKTYEDVLRESKGYILTKTGSEISIDFEAKLISKKELKAYLTKKLMEKESQAEIDRQGALMSYLGVIDHGYDLKGDYIESYSNAIEGLYDDKEKTLYYVLDGDYDKMELYNPFAPNIIVIHELVHALQDQKGFLGNKDSHGLLSDDMILAKKAVTEGGATYVSYSIMSDHLKEQEENYGQSRPGDVELDYEGVMLESSSLIYENLKNDQGDELIYELMTFPYISGGKFMKYGHDTGGWTRVDEIYAAPPTSTEQIIHPEKYFLSRDDPKEMPASSFDFLAENGTDLLAAGNFGEFGFYTYIGEFKDRLYAKMASAGWGNDRYWLYENGAGFVFISESVWDSPKESDEFCTTMKEVVENKLNYAQWDGEGDMLIGRSGKHRVMLGRKDSAVLWVETNLDDGGLLQEIATRSAIFPQQIAPAKQ